MDWSYMLKVLMSMIFFAPLLIALVGFAFVGVLVLFEGLVAFATKRAQVAGAVAAPVSQNQPGPIVAGLKEAIAEEATAEKSATGSSQSKSANQ